MSVNRRTSSSRQVVEWLSILAILTLTGCSKHGTSSPQLPVRTWEVTFGGSANEGATAVAPTSDGGYLVVEARSATVRSDSVIWVVKIDSLGRVVWNNPYEQGSASAVLPLPDGGYVLAAERHPATPDGDVLLTRFTAGLDIQWSHAFGGSGTDAVRSLRPCPDGGYILAGHTTSFGEGGFDIYVVKTRADGTGEWEKTFGGGDADWGAGAAPARNGGFFITGQTQLGSGEGDFYLVRTDDTGRKIWDKFYGGPREDEPVAGMPTADGGYLMAGFTLSYGAGGMDGYVVKTDDTGRKVWDQTCGGAGDNWLGAVAASPDGGFVLAGFTESSGAGGMDVYLLTDALFT